MLEDDERSLLIKFESLDVRELVEMTEAVRKEKMRGKRTGSWILGIKYAWKKNRELSEIQKLVLAREFERRGWI